MLVFLSTKATCRHEPDLLSIALVTAEGAEFYAERIDFNPDTCTMDVEERILPLMGRVPDAPCTYRHLKRRLVEWLRALPEPATIVCEALAHWLLVVRAVGQAHPGSHPTLLNGFLVFSDGPETEFWKFYDRNSEIIDGLPRGHALVDARVLRRAFLEGAPADLRTTRRSVGRSPSNQTALRGLSYHLDPADYRE